MADRLFEASSFSANLPAEPDPLKGGDIYAWAIKQAALLREGRFGEVDVANIADEIESVGKSDLRALTSNVENVLMHMLKWEYQIAKRTRSWATSIFNSRLEIEQVIEESPSLSTKRQTIIVSAYRRARLRASNETMLNVSTFPPECPYSWSDLMGKPYELETES